MAQTYTADIPDGATNILQDNINSRNNENTLRSNFSGTAFPDTPVAGQHCYRTDTGIEYIFDGTTWVEVAANNTLGLDVAAAKGTLNNLSSRLNVSINPDGTLKDPTTANVDEFKVSNVTPTYVDATTFSVPDDLTGIFTAGRILKITDGAEVKYLSVVSSAFDTVTNVVVDGTITASISAVDYSLAQYGLPKASETVKGVVEVGSNISVADGVISVPEATETVKGVVEVGANLSVDSGVISVPEASSTVKGVVELATDAEVIQGTDTERAVTPAGLLAGFPTRLRSNLLGTVSQTGGVPTGAVIERGSNANGSYVKFADGTMICFMSWAGAVSVEAYGATGLYFGLVQLTLPATFYAIEGGAIGGMDQNSYGISTFSPTSTTTVGKFYYFTISPSVTSTILRCVFFGRWF